tara:strand:+ start:1440 stop:1679 length:240 start_codon:yes stop_codon:yes gene_type:complete
MRKRLNEWADASKVLHGLVIFGFMIAFMVSILSCQDFHIGKTEEELAKEMFRVDSLLNHIQYMLDSASADGSFVEIEND